ncbi:MAG: response regulator [Sphingomicrobium sp.]
MIKRSAWLIIAAALLPILLFVVLQSGFSAREERQRLEDGALDQSELIVASSDAILARSLGALDAMSTVKALADGDVPGAYRRAGQIAKLEPDWVSVILTRAADGSEMFDLRRPIGPPRAASGPRLANSPTEIGSVVDLGPGCPCIALSRRAGPNDQWLLTVLLSRVPFVKLLPGVRGTYAVSALVAGDGTFIARSLNDDSLAGRPGSRYLRKAVADGRPRGIYSGFTLEGLANYTAFARSALSGWSGHVAMSSGYIDDPRQRAFRSLGLGALLSLLFAVFLVLFALRQVAEGRRLADRVEQAQKLEALGQLTGGIAHDFNNLLTPIIGALDFLARKSELDARARRMASGALASAERAAKLTAQLLTFSRRQKLLLEPVDLCAMLGEIRPLLEQSLGKDHPLELDLASGPCFTRTDLTQFELAVLNLVINARDASPVGAAIVVAVEPGAIGDTPAWLLSVTDRGSGMSEDIRRRALEPFFSTKPHGRGTGLGLAQVFGVAEQSNGQLEIDSGPGEGTRVTLRLPACAAPAEQLATGTQDDADAPVPRALQLLVVDDDPAVRATIVHALEDDGHVIDSVGNPATALEAIRQQLYDLAIVDFAMPEMNGAELIAAARALRPDLRCLIVTGYLDSAAVEAAAPHVPIIRKPFDPEALRRKVRELCG